MRAFFSALAIPLTASVLLLGGYPVMLQRYHRLRHPNLTTS